MIPIVYIDTSVAGGKFDMEFEFWTTLFFKAVEEGQYQLALSTVLDLELEAAPERVRNFVDHLNPEHYINIEYNNQAQELANKYIEAGIVGSTSIADCRHIATATVNKIDILTSWNFKHIVNLNKIRLYNEVNNQNGYGNLEIRTPRELLNYENGS